jgi:toxin ParE1/3/4
MPEYRLSLRADADIAAIAAFTIKTFGMEQARHYRDGLEHSFKMLADQPMRGRSAAQLAPDLRRWNYRSHVIFYVPDEQGVLIVRVLHQRMDFERHPMTDD